MPLCFLSSLKTPLTGIKPRRYQGYALRFLSLCLLVIFIASAHAVSYKINGVKQDKLKDNIRLHLNNLDVETELLNDPFWQDEVITTVATAVQPFGYYNSNATVEVTKDDEVVVTVSLSDPLLVLSLIHI